MPQRPLITALIAMGYRRLKPEHPVYAKPMGYACVFVHEQTGAIHSQINGADGKQHCWKEEKLDTSQDVDAICHEIAHFEAYGTNTTIATPKPDGKCTYAFETETNIGNMLAGM